MVWFFDSWMPGTHSLPFVRRHDREGDVLYSLTLARRHDRCGVARGLSPHRRAWRGRSARIADNLTATSKAAAASEASTSDKA